jgi:hypothetical protein
MNKKTVCSNDAAEKLVKNICRRMSRQYSIAEKIHIDFGWTSRRRKYCRLVSSGWYSGTLINNDLDSELERIADQLALFKAIGASVIVYGETFNTVQNRQEKPLSSRPRLDQFDVAAYGRRLTALAEHCAGEGVPLTFHHHMGTAVETEAELDALTISVGNVHLQRESGEELDEGRIRAIEAVNTDPNLFERLQILKETHDPVVAATRRVLAGLIGVQSGTQVT